MLDCFVDGLLSAAKIPFSSPVLFSGIEPSTHRPMDPSTQRHPRGSPVTSVLSTLPVVVTILLLLIFRPRDAISSTTPTLLRDWHGEMCRASTVRGQWECRSQESNIGYTSIYLGASSRERPFPSPAAVTQRFRPTCSDWSSTLELCTGRPCIIHPGDSKSCSDIALVTTGATRSIVGTTVCPRPREAAAWAPRTSLVVAPGAIPNSSPLTCRYPSDVDAERDWGRFVFVAASSCSTSL